MRLALNAGMTEANNPRMIAKIRLRIIHEIGGVAVDTKFFGNAITTPYPRPEPTRIPRIAPNTEVRSASQRIVERIWRRVAPTARSRPISRVRSMTERMSVFMTPRPAMSTEAMSSALMMRKMTSKPSLKSASISALV